MAVLPATQRSSLRLPCSIQAEIKFSGGGSEIKKKAIISNISATGIQILSPSFVATGQKLTAAFKLPGKPHGIYNAQIMRIESLQGRMIGHFPYALGAKFIEFKPKEEKRISNFIKGELSCSAWRGAAAWILLLLAGAELARIMVYSQLLTIAAEAAWWEKAAPFFSALLCAGYLLTSVSAILNRRGFTYFALPFLAAGAAAALLRTVLKMPLLAQGETGMLIWGYEVFIFAASTSAAVLLIKMAAFFKNMELALKAESAAPGGRPTFTIL